MHHSWSISNRSNCNTTKTERQIDRQMTASSCSVCSLRLPRRTNALSTGTWDECSTCAHSWQDITVFTQELSPTDWAMFWHEVLLQFSLSCLLRLRRNWVGLHTASLDLSLQSLYWHLLTTNKQMMTTRVLHRLFFFLTVSCTTLNEKMSNRHPNSEIYCQTVE